MIDTPHAPGPRDPNDSAAADRETLPNAAKADESRAGVPETPKGREQRRAEREREAYKHHYHDAPQGK
jgi:hypothetical protein